MKPICLGLLIIFFTIQSQAQTMRPVEELVNTQEPGWPLVKEWIAKAKNKVEVLPCDTAKAREALFRTQVTTRSPMGAIVYSTGGILIDDGWIRILGSGSTRLPRNLPEWNKGKTLKEYGESSPFYLVADDAIGGFFAINGGGFGKDLGKIYYLSPDNLQWEALDLTYTDFLNFCFTGDLEKFYKGYRWKGWKKEVAAISGDQAFNFSPPLFTKEGKDFTKNSRKPVSVEERYYLNLSFKKQLGIN